MRSWRKYGVARKTLPKFRLQLFGEFGEIDNHPLMRSRSDLLKSILRLDPKFDSPSFAFGHFRVGGDTLTLGSRCSVKNVDMDADGAFARVKVRLDGVQCSVPPSS